MFDDRQHAGRLLAKHVVNVLSEEEKFSSLPVVVVGLPRGGIPVASEVASQLRAPLTLLVSKKIGAPFQPDLALGAVSSGGEVVLNQELLTFTKKLTPYLAAQTNRLKSATREIEDHWLLTAGLPKQSDFSGKCVIVVDDGVATGMTTLAALNTVRSQNAARVVLASPVISEQAVPLLQQHCDLIIALITPHNFRSVGQFYLDFSQVGDDEVVQILKSYRLSHEGVMAERTTRSS